jgi:hypothetical protein
MTSAILESHILDTDKGMDVQGREAIIEVTQPGFLICSYGSSFILDTVFCWLTISKEFIR